jgi:hypothetical protein
MLQQIRQKHGKTTLYNYLTDNPDEVGLAIENDNHEYHPPTGEYVLKITEGGQKLESHGTR